MKTSCIAVCAVLLMLLLAQANLSVAAACNPTQLAPCQAAITSNSPPSPICCTKLRQQQPCLCQYLKNPNFSKFLNNPNAKKVASTCKVSIPKC